jgi:hypothetical protein
MSRILKVITIGYALLLDDFFSAPYALYAVGGGLLCTALFYYPVSKIFPLVHKHYYYCHLFWIVNGFIAGITAAGFRLIIPYNFVINSILLVHLSIDYGLAGAAAALHIASFEHPRSVQIAGLIGIIVGTIYSIVLSGSFYAAFIVSNFTFGLIQFSAPAVFSLIFLYAAVCIRKLM